MQCYVYPCLNSQNNGKKSLRRAFSTDNPLPINVRGILFLPGNMFKYHITLMH